MNATTGDQGSLLTRGAKLLLGAVQTIRSQNPTLVILNIRLLFRDGNPVVNFSLEGIGKIHSALDGELQSGNFAVPWEIPYSSFEIEEGVSLSAPPSLLEDLKYRLQQVFIGDGQPIWLRLVRPYGWLGMIPWESVFVGGLKRPVLRLPDSPWRQSERADIHQSALIVDPPMDARDEHVRDAVRNIATAILKGSSRSKTQVHVFPSNRWFAALQELASGSQILVHDPRCPKGGREKRSQDGIKAWTDWVLARLGREGLDALHLFGRATQNESSGRLIVTSDPCGTVKYAADVAIDVAEFDLLMSRAGAWAATFVPAQTSDWLALSQFADALARQRPCAVLCQTLIGGQAEASFHASYRLLFDAKAQHAPWLEHGFMYCHPALITETASMSVAASLDAVAKHALVLARRAPVAERLLRTVTDVLPGIDATNLSAPPNWVGATQRFLESEEFQALRQSSEDVLLSKSLPMEGSSRVSTDTQSLDVLNDIQDVVGNYLKKIEGKPL